MEFCDDLNDTVIVVGKYLFSAQGFAKASHILQQIACNSTTEIIVDEIGPLELNNNGFAFVLKDLLKQNNLNLLLVVREGLVQSVIDYFSLKNVTIITSI
jgi:nucleoside-triphosphatase THEP1